MAGNGLLDDDLNPIALFRSSYGRYLQLPRFCQRRRRLCFALLTILLRRFAHGARIRVLGLFYGVVFTGKTIETMDKKGKEQLGAAFPFLIH